MSTSSVCLHLQDESLYVFPNCNFALDKSVCKMTKCKCNSDLCASKNLRSACEHCFIVPSQRGTKSLSQTFKLNVPSWWNDLANSIRILSHLQESAKTHLFHLYLPKQQLLEWSTPGVSNSFSLRATSTLWLPSKGRL